MIISDIKKTKYGYFVYSDQEVIHLEASVFLEYKLKKNQTLSLKQFRNIIKDNEKAFVKRKAVVYVAKQRSVLEFKNYLRTLIEDKIFIEELTKTYKQKGYLDDTQYALDFVHKYESKYGKNRLKNMLIQKGIHQDIIENTLKNHVDMNLEMHVKRLVLTVKKENYEKTKQTIIRRMGALGYDVSLVTKYVDKYLKKDFNEEETIIPYYNKAKKKFEKKYEGTELEEAIIKSLLNKGFTYQTIKKIM